MKKEDALKEAIKIVLNWYDHYSGIRNDLQEIMKKIDIVADDLLLYSKTGKMSFSEK